MVAGVVRLLGRYEATYIALAEPSEVPVQSASIAVYFDTEPSSAVSWCGMSQPHPPYRSSESSTLGLETAQAVKVVKFLAAFLHSSSRVGSVRTISFMGTY
jgi:hypothetical protein